MYFFKLDKQYIEMQFNRTLLVCGCTVLFLLIIFVPSANTKKGKRKKPKGKKITYFFYIFILMIFICLIYQDIYVCSAPGLKRIVVSSMKSPGWSRLLINEYVCGILAGHLLLTSRETLLLCYWSNVRVDGMFEWWDNFHKDERFFTLLYTMLYCRYSLRSI